MEEFIQLRNEFSSRSRKRHHVFTKRQSCDVLQITWCDRIISHNEEANNLTQRSVVKIHLMGGRRFRYEQGAPKSITSHYDSKD